MPPLPARCRRRRPCGAGSTAPAPAPAPAPTYASRCAQFIDSLIDVPEFRSANWGILVVDPGRGDTLYARNADKLFMPASNMKILTGSTALTQLGPDYRWSTTLLRARTGARTARSTGDLVVRGNGDPSMSEHMHRTTRSPRCARSPTRCARMASRASAAASSPAPSPFPDAPLGFGWDVGRPRRVVLGAASTRCSSTRASPRSSCTAARARAIPCAPSTRPAATYPRLIVQRDARWHRLASADTTRRRGTAHHRRPGLVARRRARHRHDRCGRQRRRSSSRSAISRRRIVAALREALRDARHHASTGATTDTTARVGLARRAALAAAARDASRASRSRRRTRSARSCSRRSRSRRPASARADSAQRVVSRASCSRGARRADGFAVRDGSGLSRHDYVSPRTIVRVLDAMRAVAGLPVVLRRAADRRRGRHDPRTA